MTSTMTPPPPPPAPEPSDTEFEAKLSFVTLKDDNLIMFLNGEPGYPIALPKYISVKKNREDRIRIVEKKIFDGCHISLLKQFNKL